VFLSIFDELCLTVYTFEITQRYGQYKCMWQLPFSFQQNINDHSLFYDPALDTNTHSRVTICTSDMQDGFFLHGTAWPHAITSFCTSASGHHSVITYSEFQICSYKNQLKNTLCLHFSLCDARSSFCLSQLPGKVLTTIKWLHVYIVWYYPWFHITAVGLWNVLPEDNRGKSIRQSFEMSVTTHIF
jgi:hypothetical protein